MAGERHRDDHQVGGAGDVDVRAALHRHLGGPGGRCGAGGDVLGDLLCAVAVPGAEQDPLPRGGQSHPEPAALRAGAAQDADDQFLHRAPVAHGSIMP